MSRSSDLKILPLRKDADFGLGSAKQMAETPAQNKSLKITRPAAQKVQSEISDF
jgi:hypothetical protein